ncbi:MAG: hypothetical protein QXU79_01570 [Candidatus Micrarchaeaceae archaeon]
MELGPILQLRFPDSKDVEVYLVKLEDGTIVARTKDELERMGIKVEETNK